jgi:triosephosphate isomerase
MSKSFFLGANWKMYPPPEGALAPDSPYHDTPGAKVVVFPTSLHLLGCHKAGLVCGAQCARPEQSGAFTGDIGMAMLKAENIPYVLCGHSERRTYSEDTGKYHDETDQVIAAQVRTAVALNITPVVCIGETLDQRNAGKTEEVLGRQLETIDPPASAIIAYEPVWAIGTGMTPKPPEVVAAHAFIRSRLRDRAMYILYGGSMNPKNAAELLALDGVDGGLIGGASLKPKEFAVIVEAAKKAASK